MSYFNWRGNKQGKSIYDTKIPLIICLLLPVTIALCLLLAGCKTSTTLSTVNPRYKECLEKGEKPPKDLEIWIPEKKMEADGIGKIEADFEKHTIKRDSGLSLKVPDVSLDIDKLGD